MESYIKTRIEEIKKRYTRKTIKHPEKRVCHYGDCGIYNSKLEICTCGLLLDLMVLSPEIRNELYPEYEEEIYKYGA